MSLKHFSSKFCQRNLLFRSFLTTIRRCLFHRHVSVFYFYPLILVISNFPLTLSKVGRLWDCAAWTSMQPRPNRMRTLIKMNSVDRVPCYLHAKNAWKKFWWVREWQGRILPLSNKTSSVSGSINFSNRNLGRPLLHDLHVFVVTLFSSWTCMRCLSLDV